MKKKMNHMLDTTNQKPAQVAADLPVQLESETASNAARVIPDSPLRALTTFGAHARPGFLTSAHSSLLISIRHAYL